MTKVSANTDYIVAHISPGDYSSPSLECVPQWQKFVEGLTHNYKHRGTQWPSAGQLAGPVCV